MKTFFIRTYGCQMNELDSEVMTGILLKRGLIAVDSEENADLIIYNTCSIRDLAERKALGKLGIVLRNKRRNPVVGIAGCMATSKKEKLFAKIPKLDFILGPNNIHNLTTILDELDGTSKILRADLKFHEELDYEVAHRKDQLKASVSIIRGCNKHCTYCIVPYARGPEVSRHPNDILQECTHLIDQGYKEITLLGQNVDSYGKDRPDWKVLFSDLLCLLDPIAKNIRIRFMTSHPVDITRELMEAIRDLPSLCEFVHFPLQSGSSRILKKMNRLYTREEYDEKISLFRELVPNVVLGTDIIVGFPTETEEEFEETLLALKRIRFAHGFLFAYSERKGAPAARWKDDVSKEIKEQRLQQILDVQEQVSSDIMKNMLGQTHDVLIEGISPKNPNMVRGRTRSWHTVVFPGSKEHIGTTQQVRLTSTAHQTFIGERYSHI